MERMACKFVCSYGAGVVAATCGRVASGSGWRSQREPCRSILFCATGALVSHCRYQLLAGAPEMAEQVDLLPPHFACIVCVSDLPVTGSRSMARHSDWFSLSPGLLSWS